MLIEHLRRLAEGEEFQFESRRKERLDQAVDKLRRQRVAEKVRIPVKADMLGQTMAGLPEEIMLQPGHLHIQFSSTVDLLTKLYQVSQAASNNFSLFRAATELVEQRSACSA